MDVSAALVAPIPGLGARQALLPPTGSRRRAPRPPPEAGRRLRPWLAVLKDTWPYLPGGKKKTSGVFDRWSELNSGFLRRFAAEDSVQWLLKHHPHFTPAVEVKEKGKKGKAVHFAEIDGPASDRLTDKRLAARDDKSAKALEKRGQQGTITLDDVKFVALLLLQDTEMQRICSFTTFMRNKNLDNFLMALLYYLARYLEKNSLEKKPKSYMIGLVEKKEMELVLSELEAAQRYLAQKYCILVLGLAMPDKHHMCCGKEKISDTQKDWKFFE
ncbi:hypothetical protein H8959_017017, partial [Pygathrix nigripes]